MRTRNTLRNLFSGLINKVVILCFPFLVRTILIIKLGVEYVGVSSLFTSILEVLNVTELGFSSAIVFSLYAPVAQNDVKEIKMQVNLLSSIYRVIGVIILVGGLCIVPFLPRLTKDDVPEGLNIYIAFLIFLLNPVISYLFYGYKNSILVVYQRNDLVSKIHTLTSILKGVLQIVILYASRNFYLYSIAIPFTTLIGNLFINQLSNYYYPELSERCAFSLDGIKKLKKQIAGVAIGRISLVCRNSFDSIIITALFGYALNGIYSNYYMVFSMACGFMGVIITSIAASVGNSLVTETKEKNEKDHLVFDFCYMYITSMCFICLYCLYQPFMEIWVGSRCMLPRSSMILFCIYFYVNQLAQVRGAYSQAAGLWWNFRHLSVSEMVANLLLNIVLGYYLGVDGILLATIITAFLFSFLGCSIITYKKVFEKSSKNYLLYNAQYFALAIIGCVCINQITSNYYVFCWASFILKTVICLFLSFIFLFLLYSINKRTRAYMINFALKVKSFIK